MKIRQGFVSNSSSTSFTVVFKPEENNINLKTFQFMAEKSKNGSVHNELVAEYKARIIEEQTNLQQSVVWAKERVERLIEVADNQSLNLVISEITSSTDKRFNVFKYSIKDGAWKTKILSVIRSYEIEISKIEQELATIENKLKLLDGVDEQLNIVSWNTENGSDWLCELAEMLIKDGRLIVLEKSTT